MAVSAVLPTKLVRRDALMAFAILAIVISVYWPARRFAFVRFDDTFYLTENPHAQNGLTVSSAKWAITASIAGTYIPLAMLSSLLDVSIWGMNAGPMHLENTIVHALSTAGWYLLWVRLTGRRGRSAMIAGLFGLHPMHVEAVAWIVERCEVLCMLSIVGSLMAFVEFVRRERRRFYWLSIALMLIAILCKPVALVMVLVIALLNIWPLSRVRWSGRWRLQRVLAGDPAPAASVGWARVGVEMIPFAIVALIGSAVAIAGRSGGSRPPSLQVWTVADRTANVVLGYCTYLVKAVWPEPMVVLYPLRHHYNGGVVAAAATLLVVLSVLAVRAGRARPYVPFGWFWFLGTMLPVIGIVQSGAQSMADRYTYLPYVGLSVTAVWWIGDVLDRQYRQRSVVKGAVLGGVVLVACTVDSRRQLDHWRNNFELYSHAWEFEPDDDIISNAMGSEFTLQQRPDLAIDAFSRAVAANPYNSTAQVNFGNLLTRVDPGQALPHLQAGVNISPDDPAFRIDLGNCQRQLRQFSEAAASYQKALQLNPGNETAQSALRSLRQQESLGK